MQPVHSIEEYYSLINAAKARCGMLKTNSAMFPDSVQRYIDLGRMLWEESVSGIVFYTNEEAFYQAYYYVQPETPFVIEKKDKPVLIQNVYKGEKKPWMLQVEESLRASGFAWADTLKHGVFTGYAQIPQIRRSIKPIERIFRKEGFSYAPLKREQIPEMLAFRSTIAEIPFYQFPYFTDDELAEEAEAERLCAVTDAGGTLIAARHLIVNGKKAYGWVGVAEQYKTAYGMAMMFLGHALDYIEKHDVKMCAWVDMKNTPSLQYHERLGTEWTGHMEDEWLLESDGETK